MKHTVFFIEIEINREEPKPRGAAELDRIPEQDEIVEIDGRGRFRVSQIETKLTTKTKGALQQIGTDVFLIKEGHWI